MTAVTNFPSLQTAIGEWMFDRTDLSGFYTSFIQNAEARFNYGTDEMAPYPSPPIRVRDMIGNSDLTLSSGSASLPATFIEVFRVTAKTDPRRKLEYASADWLDENYPTTTTSDPAFYTIVGSDLIVRPVTSSQIELKFYQKITALSDGAATNWLITAAPNVYLYGSLLEACIFLGKSTRAVQFHGLMMGAIGGLMRTDKRSTSGTQPARRASGAVA